jgi:hypothetical protein
VITVLDASHLKFLGVPLLLYCFCSTTSEFTVALSFVSISASLFFPSFLHFPPFATGVPDYGANLDTHILRFLFSHLFGVSRGKVKDTIVILAACIYILYRLWLWTTPGAVFLAFVFAFRLCYFLFMLAYGGCDVIYVWLEGQYDMILMMEVLEDG